MMVELTPSFTLAYAFLSKTNQVAIFGNVTTGLKWVEETPEKLENVTHIYKK